MPDMASRRRYRNLKQNLEKDYTALKLNDVLCPICRSILIEPVTLTCSHSFCLTCFNDSVENTNLVCPLCRIRIGSWLRKARKESKIVNTLLWAAINQNYAHHVKNKLDGIDEHFEEDCRVIVARPGEIKMEYEIEKQKEADERRKIRDAENKASEDLIKKLKDEEDYEKAVIEEKIRLDEEIARRIAAELELSSPSTSKSNLYNTSFSNSSKLYGPMDKFLKRDNETITTCIRKEYKPPKSFAEKEYTCRVLYLDRNSDENEEIHTFSPIIKKKIQQIQKDIENEQLNDSFECFEADMRYFKPIDSKFCPQSIGKPPVKVPCRKAYKNGAVKILSPSGMVNFRSSLLESAFARISFTIRPQCSIKKSSSSPRNEECKMNCTIVKRKLSDEDASTSNKKHTSGVTKSPTLNNYKLAIGSQEKKTKKSVENLKSYTDSPPFYGFDNSAKSDEEPTENQTLISTAVDTPNRHKKSCTEKKPRNNGNLWIEDESYQQRMLQEQADLELAKKLQGEFDKYAHYTRSTRKVGRSSFRRQATLDEILTGPYRVK